MFKKNKAIDEMDEFSKHRSLKGWINRIIITIAVLMSLFHLYTATFGIFTSILQRSIHLAFTMILIFSIIKSRKSEKSVSIPWYDYVLIGLSIISTGYIIITAEEITSRFSFVTPLSTTQVIIGVFLTILLVEATRRTIGNALTIIVLLFIAYGLFGQFLPGALGHSGFSLEWMMEQLYYTTSGVFGIPLGISATFVFMFILFGKFLEKSGGGQFFIDLSIATMGKYRGGPAKTAVVSSAMLGTISGSAVANTVTTGAFTIPLMKKTGYNKDFSGAVEAVASTGGQIVPPIMGAAAFIMASYLGIPYSQVALAAIIPAILYFLCLLFQVDFRAQKLGLKGLPKIELPNTKDVLKKGYIFFAPLLIIIVLLFIGYSPMRAGLIAIVTVIAITLLKSASRLNPRKLTSILSEGARASLETAIACAASGLIMGIISMTGIGLKFSSFIISIAGGSLLLTLIYTMIASIILGMGLPTVAAYIVQVGLTIPALIDLGVAPLAAHMFVFYYACLSAITPPVALASFAGAGIAGADPLRTSIAGMRLGISAFIVPFFFIYGPAMLLDGSVLEIIMVLITSIIGIFALAAVVENWFVMPMKWWARIILLGSSLSLIHTGFITDLIGISGIALIFIIQKVRHSNNKMTLNQVS